MTSAFSIKVRVITIFLQEFFSSFFKRRHSQHCTKNHISQVPEYHENFKNLMKISTFHQLFRSRKDRIFYLWKIQNKNFFVLKKDGTVFYAEENIILHHLFELKEDRFSHPWKVQNKNFPVFTKDGIPY